MSGSAHTATTPTPVPARSLLEILPPHNVLELYGGRAKGFGLLGRGSDSCYGASLIDLKLTTNQAIRAGRVSGKPHVNKGASPSSRHSIPGELPRLRDLQHGDTLFDGLRPTNRCHSNSAAHRAFARSQTRAHHVSRRRRHDPRPEFMLRLRRQCPHRLHRRIQRTLELSRLASAVRRCETRGVLKPVEGRVVDLLDPLDPSTTTTRSREVSASMKVVLPH